MKSFFIKFNILYLGILFLTLFFVSSLLWRARFEFGDSFLWEHGILVELIYYTLLVISMVSWIYALVKTWKLTEGTVLLNTSRLLALSYLIGAPLIILFAGAGWVKIMMLITDPFFF